jgi:hypothetical protein
MTKRVVKIPMTDDEMALAIEALKVWHRAIVAQGAIEFFSKEQKNLLADIRVDIETLTDKIDGLFRGK